MSAFEDDIVKPGSRVIAHHPECAGKGDAVPDDEYSSSVGWEFLKEIANPI
jgi:hypothetical protein